MNNKKLVAVLLVTALVTVTIGYWFCGSAVDTSMAMPETGGEKAPLFYRNPMNPAITSPVPAKDEMGMDYIPVYADGDASSSVVGTVLIDPVTTQSIGVRTTKAVQKSLAKTVYTLGRIDYDETSITRLHPKTEGWIEQMRVETTGQSLKHDDILLSIYSPQLVSAQEEYLLALNGTSGSSATGRLAQTALRRLELLDVSSHQIEELKQKREVKKYLHIHSPASGTVINVGVREGQYVTPKTELYFVADLSKVWVFVDVFEDELAWVKEGDDAVMSVRGIPGKTFSGQLTYIYPYADRKTRTVKARLEFENPDLQLKPDMYADIEISAARRKSATAVPTEAIVRSGTREKVFVQVGEGKFEPREVVLGVSSKGWIEVLEGVKAGEPVVTSAQFLIDSESKLREAVAKMSAGTSQMDHSGHVMDHSGHQMDHGEHEMSDMDHSGHVMDHSGQDMSHSDHEEPEMDHDHHEMEHDRPSMKSHDSEHSNHEMSDDGDSHEGHDHD